MLLFTENLPRHSLWYWVSRGLLGRYLFISCAVGFAPFSFWNDLIGTTRHTTARWSTVLSFSSIALISSHAVAKTRSPSRCLLSQPQWGTCTSSTPWGVSSTGVNQWCRRGKTWRKREIRRRWMTYKSVWPRGDIQRWRTARVCCLLPSAWTDAWRMWCLFRRRRHFR